MIVPQNVKPKETGMKQPSNDTAKTPPPTPDAMTQFGNLLERYSNADNLARRIHDVLHEINQRDEAHRAQETI